MSRTRQLLAALLAALTLFTTAVQAERISDVDRIVAIVDNNVITYSELAKQLQTIKDQLRASNTQMPSESALLRRVLERAIINRLQLQLAEQTGLRVDDETLNTTMSRLAKQNKLSLREFRDAIESEGFSYASFREDIREEIIINRLQQKQVSNRVSVTQQEIDHHLANEESRGDENREYLISHILIGLPEGAVPEQIQAQRAKADELLTKLRDGADFAEMAVSHSDGQQALKGGSLGWRRTSQMPSLFTEVVPNMASGDVADLIRSPSGFHIIKVMETRGAEQKLVTQTHARHILIKTDEITSGDDARTRLEQIHGRVVDGDDFAELARAHSDDTGSAVNGGDLGWSSPDTMVAQFEQAMDRLAPGEISKPFASPFGWHIVQVLERREHDNTDEFKRNRARQTIRKRKIEEEREIWIRRLRDEAYVKIMLDE
ncbi:molecular chaperone SurA [Solemya pervernicosa gill symbiont]|uniref:Chaperone SurA n=2 Tax=Gammaproteobacteria incertae sedis TaxID=118884 RepID=A0A1T2L4D2_9GAMM|nr:peptidylprolyl isomerase [Candidatus Reidiella endopervernicosa]OOZ39958.1 molecular chaperone SurA [Solemya pervernicosa gill symbiont]QKQ25940.1 peptidylprolyl isomerase [Candidatus Reidiella endopervernicosa]